MPLGDDTLGRRLRLLTRRNILCPRRGGETDEKYGRQDGNGEKSF